MCIQGKVLHSIEIKDEQDKHPTEMDKPNMASAHSCPDLDRERRVSFDQVDIREYYIELGDNPSCSKGPPLTIGWDFDYMGSINLDEFEECRPPRRFSRQMLIPFDQRTNMLEQVGYSDSEIINAVKSVSQERYQRLKTARSKTDKLDEVLELANRKMKRVFTRKNND